MSRQWWYTLGLVVSVAFLAVLALPYVIVDTPAVSVYYRRGLFGVTLLVLVDLLLVVGFAVGLRGLVAPGVLSGALAGFGLALAVLTWGWAVTVPPAVVMGMPTLAVFALHRWVLGVLATLAVVVGLSFGYQLLVAESQSPQTG